MMNDGNIPSQVYDRGKDIATRNFVGRFVVEFLKALNMTGYYPPDHPSIKDVTDSPLRLLQEVKLLTTEFSFVSSTGGGAGDVINVEGVFEEPVPLLDLIQSSMGEVFARKFINYLEYNRLVSFSLKTDIDPPQFKRFVATMVERKTRQEAGHAVDMSFNDMLRHNEITHVSVISVDEVVGAQRSLPWRVKIAMSRLAKDLGDLPLYVNAGPEQLQAVKAASIKDIIRPLRQTAFIRDLLVNSDLIQGYVQSLASVDVEWEILLALHNSVVEEVAWDIVKHLEAIGWGSSAAAEGQAVKLSPELLTRSLSRCAERLAELNMDHTYEFLTYLFERNLLPFERLPPLIQRTVMARKWAALYVQNPDACHQRLMQAARPEEVKTFFDTTVAMMPELVRQDRLDGVAVLLQILIRHAQDETFPGRQKAAMESLHEIAKGETVALLAPLAQNEDKSNRVRPLQLLMALGERGWNTMVQIMAESESSGVRRDILELLTKLGDAAAPIILAKLANQGQQWFVYRNLLLCLQNINYRPAVSDIKRFAAHMNPKVREQALIALHALAGPMAVNPLVTALTDTDPKVMRVAVGLLAKLRSRESLFTKRLAELLEPEEHGIPEQMQESMQIAALALSGDSRIGA